MMRLLIDTGASSSFISERSLQRIPHVLTQPRCSSAFTLADGVAPFHTIGIVKLTIEFASINTFIQAHVVQHLCSDLIIGMDYINRYNLNFDVKCQQVSIQHHQQYFTLPISQESPTSTISLLLPHSMSIPPGSSHNVRFNLPSSNLSSIFTPDVNFEDKHSLMVSHQFLAPNPNVMNLLITNITSYPQTISQNTRIGNLSTSVESPLLYSSVSMSQRIEATRFSGVSSVTESLTLAALPLSDSGGSTSTSIPSTVLRDIVHLTQHIPEKTDRDKLSSLLLRFPSVFDTTKHNIAKTSINHVINTVPHSPPACRAYPQPDKEEALYKIIQEFLTADLITESHSPYAAPAMLVKKSDGSHRLVVDYKKLNSITIKDSSPLPNLEDVLRKLGKGYCFFSKLDLKSGFYQIPINENDKIKTAFITPFGLYQFNVLPMGLKNSPPTFQNVMLDTLKDCRSFSLVYLDDIIVFSSSFQQHLSHLASVLHALIHKHIVLNPPKCTVAVQTIDYLSHTISATTIRPLTEKIDAILQIAEPRTLSQANHFLGALGWYRKFIPAFAEVAAPIHRITNLPKAHRHKFQWTESQSAAFYALKQLLISTPLFLHYPRSDSPLILTTDASNSAIGGVLQQEIDGQLRNLYYHSQLMTASQRRYSTIEKEALAIYKCFERMRPYLLGQDIIIMTDHCPLCCIMSKSIRNPLVNRISILLQEFNIIKVLHIKGHENCLPDFLSRYPKNYDDEFLDIEYGLGSKSDNDSFQVDPLSHTVAMTLRSRKIIPPHDQLIESEPEQFNPNSLSVSDNNHSSPSELLPQFSTNFFDVSQIPIQQHNDPQINRFIAQLKSDPQHSSFVLRNDTLYKLITPTTRSQKKLEVLCVPASMVPDLLKATHNDPTTGGHFSTERTYQKLKCHYWWPSMKFSIRSHIKACLECQQYNIDRQRRPGLLNPVQPPLGPFQVIGIDYCGPFKITPQGNQYVLVITDHFSRFVCAIPLPRCTAEITATTLFNEYFCHYGIPGTIVSDQGSHFKNTLMANIQQLIGFNHIFSTAYHPQSNGIVERFNSTFVPQISKLQDDQSNNWDVYLPAVVFAYNSGVHRTTQFSPYELLYGRPPRLPIHPPPSKFSFSTPNDYFRQLQKTLKIYHRVARENILHQQESSKSYYDVNRPDPHYQLGDRVLTHQHGLRGKLEAKFSPTTKIIIRQNHPTYTVRDEDNQVETKVHVSDLRPIIIP